MTHGSSPDNVNTSMMFQVIQMLNTQNEHFRPATYSTV